MSSVTEIRVRAVTRPSTDKQVVDLIEMLGPGGCRQLETTLEREDTGWKKIPGRHELDQTYLQVLSAGLPEGVAEATVSLRLRGGVAEVTRRWKYQQQVVGDGPAPGIPAAVTEAMRRLANVAVNTAIVNTVAGALRLQMQQRVPLKRTQTLQHTVSRHLRSNHQIQLSMRIRQGGGR